MTSHAPTLSGWNTKVAVRADVVVFKAGLAGAVLEALAAVEVRVLQIMNICYELVFVCWGSRLFVNEVESTLFWEVAGRVSTSLAA